MTPLNVDASEWMARESRCFIWLWTCHCWLKGNWEVIERWWRDTLNTLTLSVSVSGSPWGNLSVLCSKGLDWQWHSILPFSLLLDSFIYSFHPFHGACLVVVSWCFIYAACHCVTVWSCVWSRWMELRSPSAVWIRGEADRRQRLAASTHCLLIWRYILWTGFRTDVTCSKTL